MKAAITVLYAKGRPRPRNGREPVFTGTLDLRTTMSPVLRRNLAELSLIDIEGSEPASFLFEPQCTVISADGFIFRGWQAGPKGAQVAQEWFVRPMRDDGTFIGTGAARVALMMKNGVAHDEAKRQAKVEGCLGLRARLHPVLNREVVQLDLINNQGLRQVTSLFDAKCISISGGIIRFRGWELGPRATEYMQEWVVWIRDDAPTSAQTKPR